MKNLFQSLVLLSMVALVLACGESEAPQPAETTAAAATAVEEIPITTASEEARALFEEGQDALDVGRSLDANELFRRAVEKDPEFTHAYVNLMNTANSADEYMRNLELAESGTANASEGESLLVQIARTFVDVDTARRLELAEQLTDTYSASPRAWLQLASVQTSLNAIEDARTSLGSALALDPEMASTHRSLGFSYLFNEPKDFAQGEAYMQRVVELKPEEANAHVDLGDAYRAQSKLEEARNAYARATELDPTGGLAFSKKGHANSFLGNADEAKADYAAAVEAGKDQQKVIYATFGALVDVYAGNPQAALGELERLYESIDGMGLPEDQVTGARITALSSMARIALSGGELEAAKGALQRRAEFLRAQAAVVGDDDFTQSQEANIALWEGELAARAGDYDGALAKAAEIERLVESQTSPRKMESYHSLVGLTHLLQGNHAEAVEHYRQANPNSVWDKYHLALSLEATGQSDEASGLFQEVADFNFNSAFYACIRGDAVQRATG